jgi:hypothetical protein
MVPVYFFWCLHEGRCPVRWGRSRGSPCRWAIGIGVVRPSRLLGRDYSATFPKARDRVAATTRCCQHGLVENQPAEWAKMSSKSLGSGRK